MASLGDLVVRVGANISGFKSAMGDVSKEINKTVTSSNRAFSGFDRLGDVLKGVGTQMTAAITLPLVAAGAAAFKFASDFDGAMRQVTSLLGNVSQQEFKQLSDATLELSRRMGVDAVGAAQALYEALSANIPQENVMQFLEVATGTAIAGVTSTQVAVDGLTTVINSYGLEATQAASVSDAMFTAVNFGKVTFEELASSVGIAASAANSMGVSSDELLATMAAITLQGRSSSEAFTEMQSAMKALQSPNKDMNELLEKTGYHSGQALIEAKGFAGALQELNKAADGNSAALTDAFGRIEGYNAMLHVTGPGAEIVAKSIGLMNDKLGATATAQAEIEKSAPRIWERFKEQIQAVAISAGQNLLPAFQSLLTSLTPLIASLGEGVKWFSELSGTSKAVIAGVVGIVAAMGPLVFITGQLFSSFAAISKGITAVSGLMTAFPAIATAVSTALGIAGPLAIAFGVAIAGWAIYEAVTKLQALRAEFDKLDSMQRRGIEASKDQGDTIRTLTGIIEQYNRQVAVSGGNEIKLPKFSDFASAVDPIKEYMAALENAAKKLPGYSETAAAAVETLKKGGSIIIGQADDISKATKSAAASAEARAKALEQEAKKQDALNKSVSDAKDVLAKTEALYKSGKVSMGAVIEASDDLKKKMDAQDESFLKHHPHLTDAGDAMDRFAQMSAYVSSRLSELHPELEQATLDAIALDGAIQMMSETMSNVQIGSGIEDLTLRINEGAESLPEFAEVAEETAENVAGANENAGKRVETVWQRTAQQVSTIISDLGKNFAGGILKLFDNSENEKLDQQAQELRTALGDSTAEYQSHVEKVTAELAQIPGAYEQALNQLAEATNATIADIDSEYAESIGKIKKRFDDVTKSAAKSLDRQLKDLDDQLVDKKKSYERSVEDANRSYGRDTANLKESLDDKERDYRHWVEEQNLQLRQLEGDNSASAQRQREDIQLALRQRAEDMEDTRQDYATALANEESDLKLSLDRKAADYAEAQAEIEAKQIAARETYKQTLIDAETDLKASLADRQEEYDTDKANAIAAAESARAEIVSKFEAQTAALKSELDKAAGEYDTYKTTVADKLAALEEAHKGPLQRIGDMFKSVFSGAGEALLRFAGEEVMGQLFKQLDGLFEKISGVDSIWGRVFGASASSTVPGSTPSPTTPSIPSGGAVGAVSSGIAGTLTAVFSGISAVTDVLGILGVGKGGERDRFDIMASGITSLARSFEDLGLRVSLMEGMNAIKAYVASFGEVYLPAFASLMTTQETAKTDIAAIRWYADENSQRVNEIRGSMLSSVSELSNIRIALQTMPAPIVNVYVQGDLPNLVTTIKTEIVKGMQLQGA
jgi:TP901 family phage tail tape measure protein